VVEPRSWPGTKSPPTTIPCFRIRPRGPNLLGLSPKVSLAAVVNALWLGWAPSGLRESGHAETRDLA
jgi:hypothetical protein